MPTIELPVRGMTCRACETKVTRALTRVPGVTSAKVSARRGTAVLTTATAVPTATLRAAVARAGYEVGHEARPWLTRDRAIWRDVAVAVVVVAAVAVLLTATGASEALGQVGGAVGSGGLLVVLLLGLAAGLSTCMALVGGLVLGVAARFAELHPEMTARQKMRPHIAFQVGRVAGFAVLGAGMGALGSTVAMNGRAVALGMIVAAVVMGAVGLQLTAVSPRLSGSLVALPAGLSSALRLDRPGRGYRDGSTALLGAASFFLPCGFTQAVQVFALSTGSPVRASAVMAVFALGTAPGLLGVGGLTAGVRGAVADRVFRFAGVAVLGFALVNLGGAAALLAPRLVAPGAPAAAATVSANVTLDGDVQVLRTTQVATGYEPADATVYVGQEVRWEVDSVASSCASALYAPDLGVEKVLEPGVNVFTFTPRQVGTIRYSCYMGMYWGSITVIEAPVDTSA